MGINNKISVIIPVFNGEKYLEACVESIRGQIFQNTEIVIINDGSVDGTGKVCEKLNAAYDNVRILTLHDEGVSAARNAGIEAATGDLVTFVDADDRICPEMLQVLYECMLATGSDIAGCRFFTFTDENGWKQSKDGQEACHDGLRTGAVPSSNGIYASKKYMMKEYTPKEYVRDEILQANTRCWSKLYRREAIGNIRFRTDFTIGEDMLFLIDILANARKITETDYMGYAYFKNPLGAINRKFIPAYMHQITCWELARDNIMRINDEQGLYVQATTILMMAVMLTAGKLAALPSAERRERKQYVQVCHEKLQEAMKVKGAYGKLSGGYRIKTKLFQFLPWTYLFLYHYLK